MTNDLVLEPLPDSLRRFVESVPSADTIRARLSANSAETKLLRKMLRLANDRDRAARPTEMAVSP